MTVAGIHPLAGRTRGRAGMLPDLGKRIALCAERMAQACTWLAAAASDAANDDPDNVRRLRDVACMAAGWTNQWGELAGQYARYLPEPEIPLPSGMATLAGWLEEWGTLAHCQLVAFSALTPDGHVTKVVRSQAVTAEGRKRRSYKEMVRARAAFGAYAHRVLSDACEKRAGEARDADDAETAGRWKHKADVAWRIALEMEREQVRRGRRLGSEGQWTRQVTAVTVAELAPTLQRLGLFYDGQRVVER